MLKWKKSLITQKSYGAITFNQHPILLTAMMAHQLTLFANIP